MAKAPLPDRLYALFESQGLFPSSDEDWAYLAHASNSVQEYRHESGVVKSRTVSRTSVLSALLLMEPFSAEVLLGHGFSTPQWTSQLGIPISDLAPSDLVTSARDGVAIIDVPIRPDHWLPLISAYAQRFGNRPLDFDGMFYMLLSSRGEGRLRKRLMAAGLRINEARAQLEVQLVATWPPSTVKATNWEQVAGKKAGGKGAQEDRVAAPKGSPAGPLRKTEEWSVKDSLQEFDLEEELKEWLFEALGAPLTAISLITNLNDYETPRLPKAFAEVLSRHLRSHAEEISQRWETIGEYGYITPDAHCVLERAQQLANEVSESPPAGSRHLMGALLLHRGEDPLEWMVFPLPRELHLLFLDHLESHYPGDDLGRWRQLLLPTAPVRYAGFHTEGFEGPDRLGITRHVNALAALMASVELEPPLSIGLFGDWGSGKSFFMHKLQQRIHELSEDAFRRQERGLERGFHPSVVQVRFNAWNYAEAELWASLVAHIFESLHRHFSPPGQGENEEWRKLLIKLDAAQQGQGNAVQQLKLAEDELAEARAEQDRRREKWILASTTAWTGLRNEAKKTGDSDLSKAIKNLEQSFRGEELNRLRLEVLDHKTQAESVLEGAAARWAGLRQLARWPALVTALVIVAGLLLAFQWAAHSHPATLAWMGKDFGEMVAVVSGLVAWAGTGIRKAGSVIKALGAVEKAVREGRVPKYERMQLEAAEAAVGRAEEELADQRRRVMELQARVETTSPVRRLSRFLAERAESSDYRKHLGLPALARRDFEELGKLMNTPFQLSKSEVPIELTAGPVPEELRQSLLNAGVTLPETPTLTALQGDGSWSIQSASRDAAGSSKSREVFLEKSDEGYTARVRGAHIDRIILYIDDLDRCRAERVVEVLEAVHLLLALPLFVVVVGVDARWVEKALREHHSDLWSTPGNGDGAGTTRAASARPGAEPQDYLEKIFQVPLWLQPMPETATKRLLKDLVGEVDTEEGEGQKEGDENEGDTRGSDGETGAPPDTTPDSMRTADDVASRGAAAETTRKGRSGEPGDSDEEGDEPEMSAEAEGADRGEDTVSEAGSEAGADPTAEEAQKELLSTDEAIPRGLLFTAREFDFIEQLAPVIRRSPRTAKRFVNAYRVLRASQPSWRLSKLVGTPETDNKAQYRPVLLLLAAVVGCPREARELLTTAASSKEAGSFLVLAEAMESVKSDRSQWAALVELLPEGGLIDEGDLRYWAREVGRYSFRYGTGLGEGVPPAQAEGISEWR